jgi:hypothetical protein
VAAAAAKKEFKFFNYRHFVVSQFGIVFTTLTLFLFSPLIEL